MLNGKSRLILAGLLFAGLVAGAGCQNQNKATQNKPMAQAKPSATTTGTTQPAAQPAKVTAAEPAKPAAKPVVETPRVTGDHSSVSQAFPTGDRRTSAVLLTTVMPSQVRANTPYNFEYQVTNLTDMSLSNVVVTSEGTNNLAIASSSPAAARNGAGNLQWTIPTIASGKTETIRVSGTAAQVGKSGNCASVTYSSSLCAATDVVMPALAITKATSPAAGTVCDTYTYTIEVKNTGTGATSNVHIKDTLPAGMTLADGRTTTIDDNVGTLAAGQSARRTYQVKASKAGAYANKATAEAEGGLTAESNVVNNTVVQPSIALTADCPKDIRVGKAVAVKFNVKVGADANCGGTTVKATLPAGASGVTADNGGTVAGNTVTWNLGNVAANEARTLTVNMKPAAGSNQVSATATCACAAPATANCAFGVQGVPDIGTGISDDVGVIEVGLTHEFNFVVKNQGQIDLTNVKVEGQLDEGLQFVSTTWPGGAQGSGQKINWAVGTLKAGETKTFKIICKGVKAGELFIQTVTTSDQTPRGVRNDEQVNYVD